LDSSVIHGSISTEHDSLCAFHELPVHLLLFQRSLQLSMLSLEAVVECQYWRTPACYERALDGQVPEGKRLDLISFGVPPATPAGNNAPKVSRSRLRELGKLVGRVRSEKIIAVRAESRDEDRRSPQRY
jgi:hypothetical protein